MTARRLDRYQLSALALVLAYGVLATVAISRNFERHAAPYALILIDGCACLDSDPSTLDLPNGALQGRDVSWFIPALAATYRLFDDVLALGPAGTQWAIYLLGVLSTCLAALLLHGLARRMLGSPGQALLALGLFLAAPFTFAVTAHWQQSPTIVLLLLSLAALRRRRHLAFLLLTLAQALHHPVLLISALGFAWAVTRPSFHGATRLFGLPEPGPEEQRAFARTATVLVAVFGAQVAWLAIRSVGVEGSLTGYFLLRKLMVDSLEQLRALPSHLVFFAPFLLLPFKARRLWPAFLPLVAYVTLGSQGLGSATAGHYQGVTFLAWLTVLEASPTKRRSRLAWAGLVVALLVHLTVPWSTILPTGGREQAGSPLAAATWRVPPHETAIDDLIAAEVPPGTATCLTNYELMPRLTRVCRVTTPITYPARREHIGLRTFLAGAGAQRLAAGHWERVILDPDRLAHDPELPKLLDVLKSLPNLTPIERPGGPIAYRRSSR